LEVSLLISMLGTFCCVMSMLSEAPEGHPVAKDNKKQKKTHVYSERMCEHSDLYLHKLTYTYIYIYIYI
jgi:hypothetical protein